LLIDTSEINLTLAKLVLSINPYDGSSINTVGSIGKE